MTTFDYYTFISILCIAIPLTFIVIIVFESQGD